MLKNGTRFIVVVGCLCCASMVLAQNGPRPQRAGGMRGENPRAMGGMGGGPGFGMLALLVPHDPAEVLQQYPNADTYGDGTLSPAEHRAFMMAQRNAFEKELLAAHPQIDTNNDGALAPDEMRSGSRTVEEFVAAKVLASNPQADTNGDGTLSREELRAVQSRRMGPPSPAAHVDWILGNFQKIDADRDGQITVAELEQFKKELPRPERAGQRSAARRGSGRNSQTAASDTQTRGQRATRRGQAHKRSTPPQN